MKASEATRTIQNMLGSTVATWPGYDPAQVPFVVYDDDDVQYINHPSPPQNRPGNLMAATAVEVGGVLSATLPAVLAEDDQQLVPLAYHEGFHVHQATFTPGQSFDFFNALAHYPELDAEYRALCKLEAVILNSDDIEPINRASQLSAVAVRRGQLLGARADDLVNYEHTMERNEGTASYVEQRARQAIYGVDPSPVAFNTGWSRFYSTGAAICWLLDALGVDWYEAVAVGQSLSQVLTATYAPAELPDLASLVEEQQHEVDQIQAEIDAKIADDLDDALTIHYPAGLAMNRAFHPMTMRSLGDGRLLHVSHLKVLFGESSISLEDRAVIDDVKARRLVVPQVPLNVSDGHIRADAAGVRLDLRHSRVEDGNIHVGT